MVSSFPTSINWRDRFFSPPLLGFFSGCARYQPLLLPHSGCRGREPPLLFGVRFLSPPLSSRSLKVFFFQPHAESGEKRFSRLPFLPSRTHTPFSQAGEEDPSLFLPDSLEWSLLPSFLPPVGRRRKSVSRLPLSGDQADGLLLSDERVIENSFLMACRFSPPSLTSVGSLLSSLFAEVPPPSPACPVDEARSLSRIGVPVPPLHLPEGIRSVLLFRL